MRSALLALVVCAGGCGVGGGGLGDGGDVPAEDAAMASDLAQVGGDDLRPGGGGSDGAPPGDGRVPTTDALPQADGPGADASDPTFDAGTDAAPPPPAIYEGDYRGIPAMAVQRLTERESRVLPGRESTDPTDAHAGSAMPEVRPVDTLGDLAIASLWVPDTAVYSNHPGYSSSNWPVTRYALEGLSGPPVPAYRIEAAQTPPTEFHAIHHGLFYRFDAAVDWKVYELKEGQLLPFATVASAQVRVGAFVRVGDLQADSIAEARTFVFARADRRLSNLTLIGEGGVEGGRIGDTQVGRVVQVRYPLPGVPFDTEDRYAFGPSSWENQYGASRSFLPVRRAQGPGLAWQDVENGRVYVTWLTEMNPAAVESVRLPEIAGSRMAAAVSDDDGAMTCLFVQEGDGVPNATRSVVVLRSNAQGVETQRGVLDAGPAALNVVKFGERDHAVMARSGDRLAIHMTRLMHQSDDGLNHQGGVAVTLDASTLAVTGPMHWPGHPESPLGGIQTSSHAFANLLQPAQPGRFLGADLGDAAPRGINLYRLGDEGVTTRVVFTFKTQHGTEPGPYPGSPTYPVYEEISGDGVTYYRWSNDNATYTELGGIAQTDQGIVVTFATERSLLDNSRLGALSNEPRDLAMVRVRSDFPAAEPNRDAVVTDDLVLSRGEAAREGRYYYFTGAELPQRVAGVVFLTQLEADQSASRPHLHQLPGSLLAIYEIWRTTRRDQEPPDSDVYTDTYVDTRAIRLGLDGLPLPGESDSLSKGVRLPNRDDPFTLAGGTAIVTGDAGGRALVLTLVLPEP